MSNYARSNRPARSSRRPSKPRKPADPMLMGEPSPALTKIGRMNTEKLRTHIGTLKTELERVEQKIQNLTTMPEPDEKRIEQLREHRQRLAALLKAASERLIGKLERSKGYSNNTRPPR